MLSSSKIFTLLLGAVTATCTKTVGSPGADHYDDDQLLVDFQVAQPPPVPGNCQTCTIMILERTFGNSCGEPKVVHYLPPTDCGEPGSWAAVTLNFTVTSKGAQYDRLGIFTLQDTEIWRTSTPEPTYNGIIWTYIKDVTRYIPLFSKPGPFILELDNALEDGADGSYTVTLHATFYAASQESPTANQSNLIIPISAMSSTPSGDASVPPAFSVNVTLPRNTVEIYAELYASGNGEEEFWYYDVDFLEYLPPGATYGGGSFREIRLLVDGQLAGIVLPYPVIYPGGINPSMWRPITSYGALDLPTYFIDLTPFAPTFADGLPHNVTLDVRAYGLEINQTVNQNWYVSGLLQVVTDPSGKPTTGEITSYDLFPGSDPIWLGVGFIPEFQFENFTTVELAEHSLHIEAVIISGSGQVNNVSFTQNINYTSRGDFLDYTRIENIAQFSSGLGLSFHNGVPAVIDNYEYTLGINLTFLDNTSRCTEYSSWVNQSYNRQILPAPFLLGSAITENQQATGYFSTNSQGDDSKNATSTNIFSYTDTDDNTYYRNVSAAHEMVIHDEQDGSLAPSPVPWMSYVNGVRSAFLARLPGGKSCECLS